MRDFAPALKTAPEIRTTGLAIIHGMTANFTIRRAMIRHWDHLAPIATRSAEPICRDTIRVSIAVSSLRPVVFVA